LRASGSVSSLAFLAVAFLALLLAAELSTVSYTTQTELNPTGDGDDAAEDTAED